LAHSEHEIANYLKMKYNRLLLSSAFWGQIRPKMVFQIRPDTALLTTLECTLSLSYFVDVKIPIYDL